MENNRDSQISVDSSEALTPEFKRRDAALYELALDFCRECLGWSNASPNGRSIVENRRRPESPHLWTKLNGFHFDPCDVSHLINAMRQWSDLHGFSFSIAYSPGLEANRWSVRISHQAETHSHSINEPLMRACLAVNRATQSMGQVHPAETPLTRNNPAIFAKPWGDVGANGPVALAFCKECLAWNNALLFNDFGYLYVQETVEKELADTSIPPWQRSLHFNENHIDKVILAVCNWCDTHTTGFTLEYFPSGSSKDCWRAGMGAQTACRDLASAALMSACLTAQRSLRLPAEAEDIADRRNDKS